MKTVIQITNKYLILATPLILFSLITSIYLSASASAKIINFLIALVLFILMTACFIAGWFNMVKLAIAVPNRNEPNSLIKEFPSGVGEYFLPALGMLLFMIIISISISYGGYFIGLKIIGDPGINPESLVKAMENTAALKTFMTSLTPEQYIKINLWNFFLLGVMTLIYYLFILYIPTLFYKTKNPFKAFFISLKDLFSKHIITTTAIFLLIFTINFFISIFSVLFNGIMIMHFIMTLLNFYFITIVAVGVFYYYNETFIQPFIGQNIDELV